MVKKGWENESQRHAMAKKGIKTASIKQPKPIPQLTIEDFQNALIYFNCKTIGMYMKKWSTSQLNSVPPIVKVTNERYDKYLNSLDDFDGNLKHKLTDYSLSDWGCAEGFIMTDGNRYVMIDTQGYGYPRYKGIIKLSNGKTLPYM
jgi:hypothetical protein